MPMASLDPFKDLVDFDLTAHRAKLDALPEIDGAWPNPASLQRLDLTEMPWKMFRRFVKKLEAHDFGYADGRFGPCWIWQGGLHPKGYGRFYLGKDSDERLIWVYTHRLAFEHWIGFPKPGYIVDHQCNVKTCCNPAHLWPESNPDNLRLAHERRPWKRRNQYSKE